MINRVDNLIFSLEATPAKVAGGYRYGRAAAGLPGRDVKLSIERLGAEFRIPNSKIRIGFTLVEMLVAILILVVGVALIVGVGSMVRENAQSQETRNIQAVLSDALNAYYDTEKAWPAGEGKPDSTADMLAALRKNAPARQALKRLPAMAISEDATGRDLVTDGFGRPLRYHRTAGLAGAPLLISLGLDAKDNADDINMDVKVSKTYENEKS